MSNDIKVYLYSKYSSNNKLFPIIKISRDRTLNIKGRKISDFSKFKIYRRNLSKDLSGEKKEQIQTITPRKHLPFRLMKKKSLYNTIRIRKINNSIDNQNSVDEVLKIEKIKASDKFNNKLGNKNLLKKVNSDFNEERQNLLQNKIKNINLNMIDKNTIEKRMMINKIRAIIIKLKKNNNKRINSICNIQKKKNNSRSIPRNSKEESTEIDENYFSKIVTPNKYIIHKNIINFDFQKNGNYPILSKTIGKTIYQSSKKEVKKEETKKLNELFLSHNKFITKSDTSRFNNDINNCRKVVYSVHKEGNSNIRIYYENIMKRLKNLMLDSKKGFSLYKPNKYVKSFS